MMATKKYQFSKTVVKFGIIAAEVVVAGLISYFTDHVEFLALIPIAEAVRNWLKNRNK